MADAKIPMTPRGAQRLKEELKRRKEVDRYNIVKAIEEARGHGDLSENADYSAAKEAQGFNEGRIKELETMLALSERDRPGLAVRRQGDVRRDRQAHRHRIGRRRWSIRSSASRKPTSSAASSRSPPRSRAR